MQRDNIRYIVTYTIFIILFVLGAVFYKQPFFSVLVLLLFVLPIISIYITSRLKDKLIISAEFVQHSIVAGNKAEMTVSVDNPTLFSFLNINLDYKAGILFYPNDINGRLSLSAPLKRKNRVCFTYSTLYPGMFEIFIYNATVTDPLHLHTFMLNCDITLHLPVYPEKSDDEYPLYPEAFSDSEDDENVSLSLTKSMDIKEIRDYRPGDKLKDIHWKATARDINDTLLVKEYENSANRVIVLLPEFSQTGLNETVRTFYSYMNYLVDKNEIYKVVLFNGDAFDEYSVKEKDDVDNVLIQSYYMPVHIPPETALLAFKHYYGEDNEVIWITRNSVIRK